jgi:hypothetical protein
MSQGNTEDIGVWPYYPTDLITISRGNQIGTYFYENMDSAQGTIILWMTPEWDGNDGKIHYLYSADGEGSRGPSLWKDNNNNFYFQVPDGDLYSIGVPANEIYAGNKYLITVRWDYKNTLDGTNYISLSINDTHYFSDSSASLTIDPDSTIRIGSGSAGSGVSSSPANAIIEGLTIYRRPLFDGENGTDVGNGDEIAQIYNSGSGQDPTLITGSWDVVFALPTNASTGQLSSGTGNAWSHPHSSNLLGSGGFMMNQTYSDAGWQHSGVDDFNYSEISFTSGMAKRDPNNVFAAGPIVQNNWPNGDSEDTGDLIRAYAGSQISGQFYQRFDSNQGTIVFWFTPEWDAEDLTYRVWLFDINMFGWIIIVSDDDIRFDIMGVNQKTIVP